MFGSRRVGPGMSARQSEETKIPTRPAEGPPPFAAVRLVQATKEYGKVLAVDHVDLEIRPRELFTLLGPSGSGKTTVLRMIAGLVQPTEGQIWIGAEEVHARPTYERNIAMVFQSLALFPHMDVFSNIAFPLRMRRLGRRELAKKVRRSLDIVRLPDIADRKITELSGGQQQRVALARALVYEPQLLLLDEPLGALDRRLREEMQLEIVRLHRDIDVTIINVTHDQREALMLSDRIGVMRLGRLEQVGPSEQIYRHPETPFVAEFLGDANLLRGHAREQDGRVSLVLDTDAVIEVANFPPELLGRHAAAVLRAESVELFPPGGTWEGMNGFGGRVVLRVFEGAATYYEVMVDALGTRIKISRPVIGRSAPFDIGDEVVVVWSPSDTPVVPISE
jgi:ABC-type Fe3+/spermidine/putrescine transport system ATPase subunit